MDRESRLHIARDAYLAIKEVIDLVNAFGYGVGDYNVNYPTFLEVDKYIYLDKELNDE